MSIIVSVVGVPVLADECTAKQLKVSYARILVEVDITKEVVKEVRVRDKMGREFVQKVIPKWRPYYCRKCNKIGHECKDPNDLEQRHTGNEGDKTKGSRKMWIPTSIAKIMDNVMSMEDLRTKLGASTGQEGKEMESISKTSNEQLSYNNSNPSSQGDLEEEGWTPVAPGKAARRGQKNTNTSIIPDGKKGNTCGDTAKQGGMNSADNTITQKDGNPQILCTQ